MKKLSIITINLNNEEGLKKTIESVVQQTFNNFEFIVIDGKSSDGSLEIIIQNKSNINYWISEPDSGIYNALNKGILQAKGEYCLFLNSGDWLSRPNILEEAFNTNLNADIIAGDVFYFDSLENKIRWHVPSPDILTAKTLFSGTIPHQSTFIKTQLFKTIGLYNENLKIVSDWLFWVEALLEKGCSYQHFNQVVSYFNMNGISCNPSTNSLPRKEQLMILQKKYPLFIKDFEQLDVLEKESKLWKESREKTVFRFLKKIYVIQLGVFFVRFKNYVKRKINNK